MRVRTPTQGLRQQTRMALRDAGFVGRFRVEHHRHLGGTSQSVLVVIPKDDQTSIPIAEFNGIPVRLGRRSEKDWCENSGGDR